MFAFLFYIFQKIAFHFCLLQTLKIFKTLGWEGQFDKCKGERDNENGSIIQVLDMHHVRYSKTCVKPPLKNRQNNDLNDRW